MSSKKVLILKGSPRLHGNSATLADRLAEGAREAGAEVESIFLQDMRIESCSACDACQTSPEGGCIIEDDMQTLYPKLRAADVIVLTSPVYWFAYSAQLKACIDRWYAFESPAGSPLRGKSFALVLSYGDTDPYTSGGINAIRSFEDMCRYLHATVAGIVYGSAMNAEEVKSNSELMEKAYKLGQRIAKG
jgi:multimeric flavodoxin WrbA